MGRNRLFLIETERAGDVTIFSNLCDHEDAKWVTGSLVLDAALAGVYGAKSGVQEKKHLRLLIYKD